MTESSERRRAPRRPLLYLTTFTPAQAGEPSDIVGLGRTRDVSQAGLRLETDRGLSQGAVVDLDIAIEERIVHAEGEVVHVQAEKDGLYSIGIRFTSISPGDRSTLLRRE